MNSSFIYFNVEKALIFGGKFAMKRTYTEERCEVLGDYVIKTGATVRAAALHFGISKSTIHKDLTSKLKAINPSLYDEVKKILETNKSERHLRGGEATRKKYLRSKRQF